MNSFTPNRGRGLRSVLEEHSTTIGLFAFPVSIMLCLLQLFLRMDNYLLLIIALVLCGGVLLAWGAWLVFVDRVSFVFSIMMFIGGILLALAYFLAFQSQGQVAGYFRKLYNPGTRVIKEDELKIELEITPETYQVGEKGEITIRLENRSEYELVFNSVMFEVRNQFYEGFLVDYGSASPRIMERKDKLGVSTALFFGEESIQIPPGGSYLIQVEIVASLPGDYSDEFFVVPFFDTGQTAALPRGDASITQKLMLSILPDQ